MDTGIREATIIGQGIGLALRGLRPIAEIQYLDYLIYALTVISDDLACLQYRTKGGQKAPMIISTRGHRLEGVWHSGSPISMMLGSMRGIYLLTPRNMTQAAGFYNTIMASDDAAVIIEPLNGYRVKEKMPSNIGEYRLPLGVPEVLRSGEDITIVTYGSCCRIVMDAALQLEQAGVSCEVVDVQTLLPFDIHQMILESVKKTNKVLFVDEDVPGGATAYMYQQVVEDQGAFDYLEMPPVTLSAKAHRPAYGSDGDYFSKPNVEDVFDTAYEMVRRCNPGLYPAVY
jgi:pyruvate/2-oxoglutarate/acetoin dehydrogenase E1 component